MDERDLPFVVGQHRHHFPAGFFARLGPAFLTEYYRAFLTSPATWTRVADADGEPAGYLVGVTDPAAHRDHVVRTHGRALVLKALVAMLLRPWLALLFARTRTGLYARKLLRYRRAADGAPTPASGGCGSTAVLTHVAVTPSVQCCGIGARLIEGFEAAMAEAGCTRLSLVTASGEDGAGPYYRRRGWRATGERRTPDGLSLTTYELDIAARGAHERAERGEEPA